MLAEWPGDTAQTRLGSWMEPFSAAFTAPTWQHVLVLIVGAILSPGRRTVAAALRVTGLDQDPRFTNTTGFSTVIAGRVCGLRAVCVACWSTRLCPTVPW